MNKITKLVGVMSIGALAMVGCKSNDPAPADQGASTEAKADGSSCGAAAEPAEGEAKPADGQSCGGGH